MRELIGKIGRFCENQVEKIVLSIAAVISLWLFVTGVVFSPDVVHYQNKNFTPGQIDEQVAKKIENLRTAMEQAANKTEEAKYPSRLTGPIEPNDAVMSVSALGSRPQPDSFEALFQSPLSYLGSSASSRPLVAMANADLPKYRLPTIPRLTDTAVDYMRAAAYVPQVEVTLERPYASAQSQVDDIDLVTVEAKFNIAELYGQFRAYFNGSEVEKEAWRDPCLAEPKFAAVQLDRQEVLDTGLWSEWTTVPPTRVCPYRQLFRVIENAKDLPVGGIAIRMATYDYRPITMALLQPESYQIASADEQWYPPSFYDRFKRIQRTIETDEKRKAREDARNQANAGTGTQTTATGRRGEGARGGATTPIQGGRTPLGGRSGQTGSDLYGTGRTGGRGTTAGGRGTATTDTQTGRGGTGRGTARGTRATNDAYQQNYGPQNPANQGPSVAEVAIDFINKQIVPTTPLSTWKEPILIWAIDDTVQPGKTYRYQMRVGVFNPVAGTGHVADRDSAKKDQVVLWSDFAPVAPPVAVHKKVYFFAKDVQERTQTAAIEVARYLRGYWRTEDFQVRPGETIGKEVETKKDIKDKKPGMDAMGRLTNPGARMEGMGGMDATMMGNQPMGLGVAAAQEGDDMNPPMIDFSTNTLLVDLVEVNDWTGGPNTRQRTYYDMLYTEDGTRIDHMPATSRNWPKALSDAYQEIKVNVLKDKKALRPFGQTGRGAGDGRNSPYGGYYGPRAPY